MVVCKLIARLNGLRLTLSFQSSLYLYNVKKGLLSILMIIYMTVSSGFAMEIHYCMGKFTGTEVFPSIDSKCGRCGMTGTKGGCCKDEQQFYKLTIEHKVSKNDYSPIQVTYYFEEINFPSFTLPGSGDSPFTTSAHFDRGIPLYIQYSVFRI